MLLLWTWIKFHVLKVVQHIFFHNMILYLYTYLYLLPYLQDWSLLQKGQLWWPSALQPLWWTPAFKGRITTPRTYAKPNMRKVGQQQRKQSKLGMLIQGVLAFHDFTIHDPCKFMIFSGINFMNSLQIHDFETKNCEKKLFRNLFRKFGFFFFRFASYIFVVKVKVMNYRRKLKNSVSKDSNLW